MSDTLVISPQKAAFEASTKLHLKWDAKLTDRELEIGKQVAFGYTQREAATIFYRSPLTIANTLRNIFRKVGARNIAEFAAWIWCREFKVTLIMSESRRKIITLAMIVLFLAFDLIPGHEVIRTRSIRGRAGRISEMRSSRGRRSDDAFEFDYLPNI